MAYPLRVYAVQERKRAMERLTHPRSSGIKTGYWSPNKKDELVERLAAYEDTGLTPEEIERLKKQHRWIPVEERLPEGTEDDYCPEFNVMTKGAVQATTLNFAPDGTWFDDFGQGYSVSPGCRCRSRISGRKIMNKSVTEILEEVCSDICDNYCKYRDTVDEDGNCEAMRAGIGCPLDKLN